jgi:hypothetical protein
MRWPEERDGRLDDASTDASKDFIEGTHELRVPVADQEPDGAPLVLERHGEIARLLGDPAADRMLGDTGQEDLAALKINEKQNIEPSERDRVDVEKVARQRAGCLSSEELGPGRS